MSTSPGRRRSHSPLPRDVSLNHIPLGPAEELTDLFINDIEKDKSNISPISKDYSPVRFGSPVRFERPSALIGGNKNVKLHEMSLYADTELNRMNPADRRAFLVNIFCNFYL